MSLVERARSEPLFGLTFAAVAIFLIAITYHFLGTVVGAIFLYYASRPMYNRLKTIVGGAIAAITAVLALIVPAVTLLGYTILLALSELQLYTTELAQYATQLLGNPSLTSITSRPPTDFTEFVTIAVDYIGVVGTLILHLIVGFALTYYLLRDGHTVRKWAVKTFDTTGTLNTYFARVDSDLKSIFFGNILYAGLLGMFAAALYNGFNIFAPAGLVIPAPTLAGILTGVSSIIPVLGLKVVYGPIAGYLTVQSYLAGWDGIWFPVTLAIVCFLLMDGIPDIVVRSYVSGRSVHIGLMIFSYVFGALLFGWYGLFLGPIVTVLLLHFAQYIVPRFLNTNTPQTSLYKY